VDSFQDLDHLTLKQVAERDRLMEKLVRDGILPYHEAFTLGELKRRSHPPIYAPPKGVA
jgi:hypothetical protein